MGTFIIATTSILSLLLYIGRTPDVNFPYQGAVAFDHALFEWFQWLFSHATTNKQTNAPLSQVGSINLLSDGLSKSTAGQPAAPRQFQMSQMWRWQNK